MSSAVDLLYLRAQGQGWGPVDELAALSSRLLRAPLTTVEDRGEVSIVHKLAGQLPRRRGGSRALLVLASNPAQLAYMARLEHWLPGYAVTAAWVIDSFWTDRISRMARHRGHLDHIFVTDRDLLEEWSTATGSKTHWAPWGTDSLAVSDLPSSRPMDLVRIGRQPPAWDDDERTLTAARRHGIAFAGRPPFHADPLRNQAEVRKSLRAAKFVLAFSNLVSPAEYTHPTREYITGRWTDALGEGTTVVGSSPASAAYTLWPAATIDVDAEDLERGLEQVRAAVDAWDPTVPAAQHARARSTLDWRWRLRDIASILELGDLDDLDRELDRVKGESGSSGVTR